MKIIDVTGKEQSWAWLCQHYGEPILRLANPGPGWRIVELREVKDIIPERSGADLPADKVEGTSSPQATNSLIIKALDGSGRPAAALPVAWYWPDAPENPAAMPTNGLPLEVRPGRAVIGETNLNGDIGFGMGRGAYYFPAAGQIGPHAAWIAAANSDVIVGLGMIGGTAHDHIDVVYQQTLEGDPVDPPPAGEWAALFNRLDRIIQLLEALSAVQGREALG